MKNIKFLLLAFAISGFQNAFTAKEIATLERLQDQAPARINSVDRLGTPARENKKQTKEEKLEKTVLHNQKNMADLAKGMMQTKDQRDQMLDMFFALERGIFMLNARIELLEYRLSKKIESKSKQKIKN